MATGLIANSVIIFFLFAICLVADRTMQSVSNMATRVYAELLWYKMPLKSRIFVQMMIGFAQKERDFTGCGLIKCNLMKFGDVCVRMGEIRSD